MISSISLQNFRSYLNDAFEFENGVNIIVGPNACGKTNLLEAILVLFKGGSYRAKDKDLIGFRAAWARLEGLCEGHTRVAKLQTEQQPLKSFDIDGKSFQRLSSNSRLPVVLFEPNHLSLLQGPPEGRRAYLDDFLEQTTSGYGGLKRRYLRTLAQRNSLLKGLGPKSKQQLFPWDVRLSQLGGQIVKYRTELVDKINLVLPKIYYDLSGTKTLVTLIYSPQLPTQSYESHHLSKLATSFDDDIKTGFTNYGPHRDDVSLLYDGHISSIGASRGEMRTGVLALKITEIDGIEAEIGKKPIFLLDDVFSELDGHRRQALTTRLNGIQSFITTTDADIVIKQLAGHHNILALSKS